MTGNDLNSRSKSSGHYRNRASSTI